MCVSIIIITFNLWLRYKTPSKNSSLLTIWTVTISNAYKVRQESSTTLDNKHVKDALGSGQEASWRGSPFKKLFNSNCLLLYHRGSPMLPDTCKYFSEADNSKICLWNHYCSTLAMNFKFSKFCADPIKGDCKINSTCRYQMSKSNSLLRLAQCWAYSGASLLFLKNADKYPFNLGPTGLDNNF